MMARLGTLYGLSGRLRFGGFCKILAADTGISLVVFFIGAVFLPINKPVSTTPRLNRC